VCAASDEQRGYQKMATQLHPKTKVISGILEQPCSDLMKEFFVRKRSLN
jgi:tRNA(adenine34) deaminase